MMEGMNQAGQEEYIWAMRTSLYREEDSDLWKDRRRSTMSQMTARKSKSTTDHDVDDYHTKLMASLLPDEVILNVDDYSHRHYDACFLFGDVSGFTDLCEKYTQTGVSGPSRMTQVLNKYLGSMVQEVLSHNGDVLKFSGDAFLAMFKTTEDTPMRDAVHEALDSSLVIQKSYGSFLTDVGVVIRVKLAISAGPVSFALIGEPKMSHYVVVGKPIWDVKAAEHISIAGDIIVAPGAWHYVNAAEYLYKEIPDSVHIKLTGVGPNWRSVQKNVQKSGKTEDDVSAHTDISSDSDEVEDNWQDDTAPGDEFSLRPAVNLAVRLKIKESLRRFIIAPVMKSIDMNEPFEYLTEMRQAVIVFINVVSHKLETNETVVLADQTYKIVCRVVDKMKGCVNKVSLFDKDLMFVVIFGLRGLKHELECQVALRCAKECHEAINKLSGVLSASIGVTTGKTYCGVFGHTLRREYTVISLIVNKAARLMVNYKGKVTCDRETFLHSKLEARHFILQEHKPLKGISHPGPVYEFREAEIDHDQLHKINARPILGRQENLKLYRNLLEKCAHTTSTHEQQYKLLLIDGEARQGKTRILDEMVYITPSDIPVNRITLVSKDALIPYQTIRLIFNLPLSLTKDSTVKQKEVKLLEIFKKVQVPDLLCVLNNVYGVNFKNSQLYFSMTDQAKHMALLKMIKQLCFACFLSLWVIVIDNCEYIDPESCEVMKALLDVRTLFIVASVDREKFNFFDKQNLLKHDPRVKKISLTPIQRCYLGALACQVLDVYAISPELENVIQTKSNGNPGWVESFLISMIQDEGLYILNASMRDMNDLGLVAPPLYMMARLTNDEAFKWQHIMEEKKQKDDSLSNLTHWQRYIDSCRDSYMNVTIRELLECLSTGGKVRVCVISPTFNVGDEEAELSMDAIILKTFDSLNFFEQLLVKCSAILGNQFLRDMMFYVMAAKDKRKVAQAVQKLFEIKVLTCAKGDFFESDTKVFKEKLIDPNKEEKLNCRCRGIKIDDVCMDLPRYASCGYLQFRSTLFREITYNLLTDNQKKEFHSRAIRYLERETRRCRSCGSGYFERILGAKYDKEFLSRKEAKKNYSRDDQSSFDGASITRRTSTHSSYSVSTTISGGSSSKKKTSSYDEKSVGSFPSQTGGYKVTETIDGTCGYYIMRRLKHSFSLTRAFSSEDFTDCHCLLILSTTYGQLIDHCTGANDLQKALEAMLEYSHISIMLCNIPMALRTLNQALDVLKEKSKAKTEQEWKLSMFRGKIYTLMGCARLELGHFQPAFNCLHKALAEYHIRFPTTKIGKRIKTCAHECKQLFSYYVLPGSILKRLDHWETVYTNNIAECLSHLCTLYIIRNQWKNAELAACWSLTKAMQSFSNFQVICTAYAHMLLVAQHFRKWSMCVAIEIHALRICHLKKSAVDAEDLLCVAKLYAVIFSSRLLRSDMEKATHIGYIVLRLCSSIRAVRIILPLLPCLLYGLLVGKHYTNANSILQELDYFSPEDADNSGRVWHLALCMCIQLETGYTVYSYNVCEKYYQAEGEVWITIRDPDARKRFYTVMWLWCVRNEKWDEASIWCLKTEDFSVVKEDDSLNNKITALYLLEGLILFLVSKLDKRNVQAVIRAENEIKCLIHALEKGSETAKIILPRLYHLKAYFKYVKSYDTEVRSLLGKAQKCAVKLGNELELEWIDHTIKAWNRTLPPVQIDVWKEHGDPDNLLDFHEIDIDKKPVYFTLPTPVYI